MEQLLEPAVQAGAFGLCAMLIVMIFMMIRTRAAQEEKRDAAGAAREQRIITVVENNTKAYTRVADAITDSDKKIDDLLRLGRNNRDMLISRPCMKAKPE